MGRVQWVVETRIMLKSVCESRPEACARGQWAIERGCVVKVAMVVPAPVMARVLIEVRCQ